MSELVFDCPHCGVTKVGFVGCGAVEKGSAYGRTVWTTLFVCRHCNKGIVVEMEGEIGLEPLRYDSDIRNIGFEVLASYPKPQAPVAPEHVPPEIAQNYEEAEGNLRRDAFTSAGMMFRKVIEQATKRLDPKSRERGRLVDRIKSLAKEHREGEVGRYLISSSNNSQ